MALTVATEDEQYEVLLTRDGRLLNKEWIMKGDDFPALHKLEPTIPGAPNFRRGNGSGRWQIYGLSQPSKEAISKVLEQVDLETPEGAEILWINCRAEPVLYIDGRPQNLKRFENPTEHCEFATGHPDAPNEYEEALKKEVLKEAIKYNGRMLVFEEGEEGVYSAWTPAAEVLTVKETFAEACSKFVARKIEFVRWPVNDSQAPSEVRFHELACKFWELRGKRFAVICNCHQGRGRTTMAMAVAHMLLDFTCGARPTYQPTCGRPLLLMLADEQRRRNKDKWEEVLQEGHHVAVACAGLYTDMLDLHKAIKDKYRKVERQMRESKITSVGKLHEVERFSYLVLFGAFLQQCQRTGTPFTAFREWMRALNSDFPIYRNLYNDAGHLDVIKEYVNATWPVPQPPPPALRSKL